MIKEQYHEIQKNNKLDGEQMYELMSELFPICRSITGNGVRETLKIIQKHIPLNIQEIPTGTSVFDWMIPKEWNIHDAYVINPSGKKIIDFKKSNIHILNYSIPIRKKISLTELKTHLHTLPDQPNVIPYLTSYYNEEWGFCMKHQEFLNLPDGEYEVVIDSNLKNGSLTYGEFFIEGKTKEEFVITCYVCHPSLANDNLSGTVLVTFLAKQLAKIKPYHSFRFLFIPETIGAITWLYFNEKNISRIKHGLVATCVGDGGSLTYKKSRRGDAEIDKSVINVLKNSGDKFEIIDFFPSGSDERQFCSPGFNLPFGSLVRTLYGKFSEYHTSSDNLEFVKPEYLADSFSKYISIIYVLENNRIYVNQNPKCEPQLGKRGLYSLLGGQKNTKINQLAMMWVLNQSDGNNSLLDISEKSLIPFETIKDAADFLFEHKLLRRT